jgi:hypothetical protein
MNEKKQSNLTAKAWQRRAGESARSWLTRLQKVDGAGLSLHVAARLAECIRLATAMVSLERRRKREAEVWLKRPIAEAPPPEPAPASGLAGLSPLDRAKEAVLQMSAVERKLFFRWLKYGMRD